MCVEVVVFALNLAFMHVIIWRRKSTIILLLKAKVATDVAWNECLPLEYKYEQFALQYTRAYKILSELQGNIIMMIFGLAIILLGMQMSAADAGNNYVNRFFSM